MLRSKITLGISSTITLVGIVFAGIPANATTNSIGLTVSGTTATVTTDATSGRLELKLCASSISAKTTWSTSGIYQVHGITCIDLFDANGNTLALGHGSTVDISTLTKQTGQNTYAAWSSSADGQWLVFQIYNTGTFESIWAASVQVSNSGGGSGGSGNSQANTSAPSKYTGPELSNPSPLTVKGGTVTTSGKKLSEITSVKINGESIAHKVTSDSELELTIPASLAPGKYDLEITSSQGRLIQYGAITIKAPTQAASFSLKGSDSRVNAYMLTELSNIGSMFNSDYKKITCVVNAADVATAQVLADKVCKTLKAGELRQAKTKSVAKTTFKGDGYWVRVYVAG